jgi:hypothetical protein
MPSETIAVPRRPAWNKGRIVGQKRTLSPRHVWSIRVRPEMAVGVNFDDALSLSEGIDL